MLFSNGQVVYILKVAGIIVEHRLQVAKLQLQLQVAKQVAHTHWDKHRSLVQHCTLLVTLNSLDKLFALHLYSTLFVCLFVYFTDLHYLPCAICHFIHFLYYFYFLYLMFYFFPTCPYLYICNSCILCMYIDLYLSVFLHSTVCLVLSVCTRE